LPADERVMEKLKDLHPEPVQSTSTLPEKYGSFRIQTTTFMEALQKMNKGASPGPSGFRMSHLRMLCLGRKSEEFVNSFTRFLSLIFNNLMPKEFYTCLCSAVLIPTAKDNSLRPDPRPIACGETLEKIIGSIILTLGRKKLEEIFYPIQLGVSISNGCELIVHSAQQTFDNRPDFDIIQIDGSNAYNRASRYQALVEIDKRFEFASPFARATHKGKFQVYVRRPDGSIDTVDSLEGARQGNTIGPLVFCFALLPLLEKLKPTLTDGIQITYIDDINLLARAKEGVAALRLLNEEGPAYGFHVNLKKTKVLCNTTPTHDLYREILPTENIITPSNENFGIELLGTPIGSKEFIKAWLQEKIINLKAEANTISTFQYTQGEWLLLYYCLCNKFNYVFRTISPGNLTEFIPQGIEIIRELFGNIAGTLIDDRMLCQASLPFHEGGCDLKAFFYGDVSLCAYTASAIVASHFMIKTKIMESTEDEWFIHEVQRNYFQLPGVQARDPEPPDINWFSSFKDLKLLKIQHQFSKQFDEQHVGIYKEMIKDNLDLHGHLEHVSHDTSGLYLRACPKLPDTSFSDDEFQRAVCHRLNAPIYSYRKPLQCICKEQIDFLGDHLLVCRQGNEWQERHNGVNAVIADLARHAGIQTKTELRQNIYNAQGKEYWPDTTMFNCPLKGMRGCTVQLDCTITRAKSNQTIARALHKSKYDKISKCQAVCESKGMKFIAVPFEVHGSTTKEVENMIDEMIKMVSKKCDDDQIPHSILSTYWKTRISARLAKGNGYLLNTRMNRCLSSANMIVPSSDVMVNSVNDLVLPQEHWITSPF
jgi:hypothetical protein